MDGWSNTKRHLLRIVLLVAATLAPAAGLHAETLNSDGKPHEGGPLPSSARAVTAAQLKVMAQALAEGLVQLHEDVIRAVVAQQLTLLGGHIAPPTSMSQPPTAPTPPTGGNGVPPPPPTNIPPAPPPPGNTPPPPPGNTPPPTTTPSPPTTSGGSGPGPVTGTPEPASVVTALIGAGLASVAAWRNRRRKQRDAASV